MIENTAESQLPAVPEMYKGCQIIEENVGYVLRKDYWAFFAFPGRVF
jgi:hypothetical protein